MSARTTSPASDQDRLHAIGVQLCVLKGESATFDGDTLRALGEFLCRAANDMRRMERALNEIVAEAAEEARQAETPHAAIIAQLLRDAKRAAHRAKQLGGWDV